ncbi:protein-export membrane protein SecD [Shewanella sp. 10N.286.52.C2]|uniref:protein translocase subunit SecD n=1 Tax=Shewanella sp. 10N.286.52.C2 TaxID=1880838 RepID=UPI000C82FBED|nr:protein translocase subunit SecD [Shewanella sp. 10N.286.52.C2]PMG29489.1 protein-export membrane protein SecD [Shewanella sp. 10N.286.52.C2]
MKKSPNKTPINRYATWKYVVLIITLMIMSLSAIPSLYGENAALHINHSDTQTIDATDVARLLHTADISTLAISQEGTNLVVVLDDDSQQSAAKSIVEQSLASDSTVALAMEPAAPDWLTSMGFKPIKLGLDLRGGVQFLLDVDMAPVYAAHRQMIIDDVGQEVRGARGRQVDQRVEISFRDSQDLPKAEAFIKASFPDWQMSKKANILVLNQRADALELLRSTTVQQNLQIMRSRIEHLGITEASVQRQGENRIRIELPGVQDPAAAKHVIGATASLSFHALVEPRSAVSLSIADDNGMPISIDRKAILGGEHIIDARASLGEMGIAEVNLSLDSVGGQKMSQFSRANIGQPMATVYNEFIQNHDGASIQESKVISVATIQAQLGSRFRITGAGNLAEAQQLALLLSAGSLTAPVTIVEERTIGPSLGAENVKNGFAALALGLALTLSFIALWYRRLGWVANAALCFNLVMLLGLIALIPGAVLTMPGIAGLVLTVGMAVDTNVLIFERVKDKMKQGYSFAQSINSGFDSAFASIWDANLTTMIVAIALYSIGNGPIQGFALTLGLGLLTSMFTGIFLSRAIINLIWGRDKRRMVKI